MKKSECSLMNIQQDRNMLSGFLVHCAKKLASLCVNRASIVRVVADAGFDFESGRKKNLRFVVTVFMLNVQQ